MNTNINPNAIPLNKDLAQKKIKRHQLIISALGVSAVFALLYTICNRSQSKMEIKQKIDSFVNTTQSESKLAYLENETFLQQEISQYTILQLSLLTSAFLFILYLVKRELSFKERDLWASALVGQITTDEYEKQAEDLTRSEVARLEASAEYRQFTREKRRWEQAESQVNEAEQEEQDEDNISLNGLMRREEDSDYTDKEFEKVDKHFDKVKRRLANQPTSSASNITAHSQVLPRSNSILSGASQSNTNRGSMRPPSNQAPTNNVSAINGSASDVIGYIRRSQQTKYSSK